MKITASEKKLYLLALALLLVAVALACAWTFMGTAESDPSAAVTPTPAVRPSPSAGADESVNSVSAQADQASETSQAEETAQTVSTVVYYQDNYGYLVPVMCKMPYQDGVAKATLAMMVQSPENDMNAARLGLRTVLPENISFDLDISGGLARIDLSREALDTADAAAEQNMIAAIVQTLTEFDSVDRVEFLIGGQKMEKLTHGTDVSKTFQRGEINLESGVSASASAGGMEPVKLYFPCESASVVIPVTRMVYANADVNTAVLELVKGPSVASALEGALPAGCGLIGVEVKDGVAEVNFTREFADLVENSDGGRLALKALVLTCTQFDEVDEVRVLVEGQPYDTGAGTLDVPSFANVAEDVIYDYIQTQSSLLFDFE